MCYFSKLWFVSSWLLGALCFGSETDIRELLPLERDKVGPWYLSDLTVTSITYPTANGGSFRVNVTVRNTSRWGAPPSTLLLWDVQNQYSQQRSVGRLAGAQSATFTFNVSAPENQGPWYFQAIADYGNVVRETNESNNTRTLYSN